MRRDTPDQAKKNDDSYTWLALEVFWTKPCLKNPHYSDPADPGAAACRHAAGPTEFAGYGKRFSFEGWCGCDSAGKYEQLEGSNPYAYIAGP